MGDNKSFSFFISYWEAIEELPEKEQLPVLKAIIKYAFFDEEPENFTGVRRAIFLLVKPTLDKSKNKAANGKQGGSKTKAKRKQTVSDISIGEGEGKGVGEGIGIGEGEGKQNTPSDGSLFTSFWNAYPENARSDREGAWEAWKKLNPTSDMAEKIMGFLGHWKASKRWTDDGGAFIPAPKNFLNPDKSYLRTIPVPAKQVPPKGASGELGAAELEAIQKVLREETET